MSPDPSLGRLDDADDDGNNYRSDDDENYNFQNGPLGVQDKPMCNM